MRHSNRRKSLFVLKDLQTRVIKQVVVLPTIALAGAVLAIAFFCYRIVGEAASVEGVLPSLTPLLISSLCCLGTMGAIIFYQAMRLSNRLAGPVYRITKELANIRTGFHNNEIKLRDGDLLDGLAAELAKTTSWVRENLELRADAKWETTASDAKPSNEDEPPAARVAATEEKREEEPVAVGSVGDRSEGPEGGALLVEFLIGVVITALLLSATIPVCLQHSRLRRLDGEIYLAMAACRNNFEDLRTLPIDQIAALDGVGFDVQGLNGSPNGLQVQKGDLDGLPGVFTVIEDKRSVDVVLYDVIAEVRWTGVLGSQKFRVSSLFAERKIQ